MAFIWLLLKSGVALYCTYVVRNNLKNTLLISFYHVHSSCWSLDIFGWIHSFIPFIPFIPFIRLTMMLEDDDTKDLLSCFITKAHDSFLHVACRRGRTDMVRFLVHECHMHVNVVDDYGRTPLHDAFWLNRPNYDIIDILLAACPDLLYVTDDRGHSPLRYAPKKHWKTWVKYLATRNINHIVPRVLSSSLSLP